MTATDRTLTQSPDPATASEKFPELNPGNTRIEDEPELDISHALPGAARVDPITFCRCRPCRMILYGSRARGDATPESDVNLLVVYRGSMGRREARRRFRDALGDLQPRPDLHVLTDEQSASGRAVIGCFAEAADQDGRALNPKEGDRGS